MKPKEYLVSIGALPPEKAGKGRLSLAHIELCKEAAAKGVSIEGYTVSKGTAADAPVVTKAKISTEKQIVELAPILYPEDQYRLYELEDGKKITRSLIEACMHTGLSVLGCPCESHRITTRDGDPNGVSVYIERK